MDRHTAPIEIELTRRERRLYDRVRGWVRRPVAGARSDLRDVVLLLPDLTMLLLRLLRDDRVALVDKGIALVGIGYVISPIDVLPAFLFGPLGWIDDVLILTATCSRVLNHVHPDVVRAHWSGQGDVLDAVQRLTEWSERQLGGRVKQLLRF